MYVSFTDHSRYDATHRSRVSLLVGHGEKLHDVPDEYLEDSLIVAKKIAIASGLENYNILQVSDHPRPPHYLPLIHLNRPE